MIVFDFQKFLEIEDTNEEERKELQSKVESLESNVRMFELKAKNAQDHSKFLNVFSWYQS